MSPITDSWEQLSGLWSRDVPPPGIDAALAARVRRESLLMRLTTAAEASLMVGLAGLSVWALADGATATRVLLLAVVWLVSLATVAFTIRNRLGSWRPLAESHDAYIELAGRRARARIRSARFVRVAAFAQAAAVLLLVLRGFEAGDADPGNRTALAFALAAALVGGHVTWSIVQERRARAELRVLERMRGLIEPEPDRPDGE